MSSSNNNALSCFPLQNLSLSLNSRPNKLKRALKDDKKVEVRWLENESDLYLKQWQRRYRQLEGMEGGLQPHLWSKSYFVEHYDDWCFTARNILDIDVQYMSSKDYNKFKPKFDFLFNRNKEEDFIFGMDDNMDEDFGLDEDIEPLTIETNQELIAALKSDNIVIKNGKLEYCIKKRKNADREKGSSEKQSKKAQKITPTVTADPSNLTTDESTSSFPSTDTSPGKSNNSIKSPRKSPSTTKITRPRPTSTRRQMYVCEYPGCVYQSDRNFNFLRHKRTHGKSISKGSDDEHSSKKLCEVATTSELIFATSKAHTLNDSSFVGLDLGSLNNEYLHLNIDSPLLPSNELNLNMVQCNSINLVDNDQSFSLSNEDYMDRQNFIMKDINTLDHHSLSDNRFSSLSLEQTSFS